MPAEKNVTHRVNLPPTPASIQPAASLKVGLILGDQLAHDSPVLKALNRAYDRLLMIEARHEAVHVWSHKARIALFLSAMRHHAQWLRSEGWALDYLTADTSLADGLATWLEALKKSSDSADHQQKIELVVVEPGEWRVLTLVQETAHRAAVGLQILPDTHFMCDGPSFGRWAGKSKTLRMEFFYRQMRKQHKVLMQDDGEPEGGRWNFDAENRKGFPKSGPGNIPPPARFDPDAITAEVIREVALSYADHPGSLDCFGWPVTRAQALEALNQFVNTRLASFGDFQDAMWSGESFGWHALLSSSLNLKLLNPREVIDAALRAWRVQKLPLASVEGFVRQILGWREFIRGVYWLDMPNLATDNFYQHERSLPAWYWTGQTQMRCMRETISQTMQHGYAHHIQRLMVTGNFALLAELQPAQVHAWYLAVYVDAIEWVEMPNTLGMALFANGGRFTSKPYVASGAYIKRMSNYCSGCRYDPAQRAGPKACPVTTLYWNFLDKHVDALSANPRTVLMARNLERIAPAERSAIRAHAAYLLSTLDTL